MIFEILASTAIAAAAPQENVLCDPNKYVNGIEPDMRYTEDSFNYESFRWAIDWLREAEWKDKVEGKTYARPFELGWEFEMMYFNRLTVIEGYTLKLRALASTDTDRPHAIDEFCTFMIKAVPLD